MEDGDAGAERAVPFLAVLSHTHPAPVSGRGVAAGPLAHLEADPTGGAAGRPGGPRGPASIPGGGSNAVTESNRLEGQLAPASHFRGFPTRATPLRAVKKK